MTPEDIEACFTDRAALRCRLPAEGSSDLKVVDCCCANILLFSQGSWDLSVKDLTAAGITSDEIQRLSLGPCARVLAAFELRRELVNYKKVCLHLFAEARRLEHELRQQTLFWFWQATSSDADLLAQLSVVFEDPHVMHKEVMSYIGQHTAPDLSAVMESTDINTEHPAEKNAASCEVTLVQHKRMYQLSTQAMMRHRGVLRAVHDARDVVKALCITPRHPDGVRNRKLRELPTCLDTFTAMLAASAIDPKSGRNQNRLQKQMDGTTASHAMQSDPQQNTPQEGCNQASRMATDNIPTTQGKHPLSPQPGVDASRAEQGMCVRADRGAMHANERQRPEPFRAGLDLVLAAVRDELHWPAIAITFLEQCLIARGAFKALSMAEELVAYHADIVRLLARLRQVIATFEAATAVARAEYTVMRDGVAPAGRDKQCEVLGAAVLRWRHYYLLQGALEATTEQERWMALLSERASYILDPTWTDMDPAAATQPQSQTRVPVMPGDDVGRRACSCATHCDAVTSPPPHGDETSVAHAGTPGPSDNATTPADGPARPRPVVQVLHAHRMFVAGDSVALQRASAFVPAGFRLGAISTECRALMNTVLRPFMMTRVAIEGWPPPHASRRTRVHAYNPITNHTAVEVLAARTSPQQANASVSQDPETTSALARYRPAREMCSECHCYFGSLWMRNNRCTVCDQRIRQRNDGNACPFLCKYADKGAYCVHAKRCFTCDSPHTCNDCRLACGDGEMVADLVKTLQPQLLLLDFDRTLASTKSGASPLPPPGSTKPITHTVDQDLKSAALWSEGGHEVHVITRNSHRSAIQQFLHINGLGSSEVHVVPKKMRKGQYIKETFFDGDEQHVGNAANTVMLENDVKLADQSRTCVFVDDDIKELVVDQWLREAPNIHRVLFLRVLYS